MWPATGRRVAPVEGSYQCNPQERIRRNDLIEGFELLEEPIKRLALLLLGLWESGLRLSASLKLRWDDAANALVVDFTGRRPMMRIPAELHKGNRDALVPITPQFAALLASVPKGGRRGRVFKLLGADGSRVRGGRCVIGKLLSNIGKVAGVLVDERRRRGKIARKFASAHDLRRAFGFRWSRLVMPPLLQELMQHESIQTTMKYYVGTNAEATADALWATVESKGNKSGNTRRRSIPSTTKSALKSSTGERT
jgi:integrase